MKTWKRLASGLLGLTLAASLAGAALAAEPKAAETAADAKQETVNPAGEFSRWFPDMGINPEDPKASEAVLARMGTAIQQSRTVGDETLALNAAVWDGSSVRLSLTAKSPNFPKVVDKYTWLNSDGCTARMPEAQWKTYVENKIESEGLSKEERERRLQYLMEQGQGRMELNPILSVVSREGNTVQLVALMVLDAHLEKPEVTLRIENVEITGQGAEQPGTRKGSCLLKGPFEFTFTLDKTLQPLNYRGDMKADFGKIPMRITSASVSPTGIAVGYTLDAKGPVNVIDRRQEPVAGKTNIDMDKDLSMRIEGVWTKDGRYVDCSGSFAVMGITTSADGDAITGNWNRKYPYAVDPATVAAVDIGGTRVELGGLERVSK